MASSKKASQVIKMRCQTCKKHVHHVKKNVKVHKSRLKLNKFCTVCRKHEPHKEAK